MTKILAILLMLWGIYVLGRIVLLANVWKDLGDFMLRILKDKNKLPPDDKE
jgi:hypothetical protein